MEVCKQVFLHLPKNVNRYVSIYVNKCLCAPTSKYLRLKGVHTLVQKQVVRDKNRLTLNKWYFSPLIDRFMDRC